MQPVDSIRFHLAHSHWALRSLIDAARALSPQQLEQDLNIGPGGVRANIAHTIECMFFFADNFAGREYFERPDFARRTATLDALSDLLDEAQHDLAVALITTACAAPDTVPWPNSGAGHLPTPAAFAQVFDHATLHRTQCINMAKRLGVTPIPDLDPLTFASLAAPRKDTTS